MKRGKKSSENINIDYNALNHNYFEVPVDPNPGLAETQIMEQIISPPGTVFVDLGVDLDLLEISTATPPAHLSKNDHSARMIVDSMRIDLEEKVEQVPIVKKVANRASLLVNPDAEVSASPHLP